jgi:UPF0271 protein
MAGTFDINCDMGEGFGNWRVADDAAVMPLISTANLACGYHAGDPLIMKQTVAMAKAAGVAVGAHVGLPDLLGFGRRFMKLSPEDVYAYFAYQIGALKGFLAAANLPLNHVKPHGAMFHVLRDDDLAKAALDAITQVAPEATVYWVGPAGQERFATLAQERGLRVCLEAYPDLDYSDEGSLIVERVKQTVAPATIYDRVTEIISRKTLTTRSGKTLAMDVESICIHSDGPNAMAVIESARRAIADCGRRVACATA